MHLGHPVAIFGHLALNFSLCVFACRMQLSTAKTPAIVSLARELISYAIKPNPGAGVRIQYKVNGGDAVGVNRRLEVLGEHLELAHSSYGSKVIRA